MRGGLAVGVHVLALEPAPRGERRLRLELTYRSTTPGVEPSGAVRVAIAVTGGDEPTVTSLAVPSGAAPGRVTVEVRLPADAAAVGIAIEDPVSGLWGTARVELPGGGG